MNNTAEITHKPYKRYIGDRIADTNLYSSITYIHPIFNIEVILLEASLCFNPMEQYISDNFDDFHDDNPIMQAFNQIIECIRFEHPEYSATEGYRAVVYNPTALIEGDAVYDEDYAVYTPGGFNIRRDKSSEALFCNAFQLEVGDTVLVGWLGKNPHTQRILTSEAPLMCTRYSQGYYRYRILDGVKRKAFERNPEAVAEWSIAYGGWIWRGAKYFD